jgi:hypothetical protein
MSPKKSKNLESHEPVSADIVYQEMYQEMRRFRDYELSASNWNSAILLALAGALLTLKYTNTESPVSILLSQNGFIKFGLSFLFAILVASGIFLARH